MINIYENDDLTKKDVELFVKTLNSLGFEKFVTRYSGNRNTGEETWEFYREEKHRKFGDFVFLLKFRVEYLESEECATAQLYLKLDVSEDFYYSQKMEEYTTSILKPIGKLTNYSQLFLKQKFRTAGLQLLRTGKGENKIKRLAIDVFMIRSSNLKNQTKFLPTVIASIKRYCKVINNQSSKSYKL